MASELPLHRVAPIANDTDATDVGLAETTSSGNGPDDGAPTPPATARPEPLLGAALVVMTALATLKDWAPSTGAGLRAAWIVPLVVALLAWR